MTLKELIAELTDYMNFYGDEDIPVELYSVIDEQFHDVNVIVTREKATIWPKF